MFGYDDFNNNINNNTIPPVLDPIENLNNDSNYVAPSMDVLSNENSFEYNNNNKDILDSYDKGENLNDLMSNNTNLIEENVNIQNNNIGANQAYNNIGKYNEDLNQNYNKEENFNFDMTQSNNNVENIGNDITQLNNIEENIGNDITQSNNIEENIGNDITQSNNIEENIGNDITQLNNNSEKYDGNSEVEIENINDTSKEINYDEDFLEDSNVNTKKEEQLLSYKCVEKIRKLTDELKEEGYDIQLSEFDFEKLFQLVIKINK